MSVQVHYTEGRGAECAGQLSDLMARLGQLPGFLGAELLQSGAQPGLTLLTSRWAGAVADFEVPPGCRSWSFTVVEEWLAPPQA